MPNMNRKFNIRGILQEVEEREKEAKQTMRLIGNLSFEDLKKGGLDTVRESYNAYDIDFQEILREGRTQED